MATHIQHRGLALIIDEQLGEGKTDKINMIVKRIASKKIPYWGCKSTDEAIAFLENLADVSFIILDWKLTPPPTNVTLPDTADAHKNVAFLKKIREHCFAPVIILSSLDPKSIVAEINSVDNTIYDSDQSKNFILIKSKPSVAKSNRLFNTIDKWVGKNPTIYSLKVWENSFFAAKHKTFWSLFQKSPMWPRILWDTYEKDSIDASTSIYDAINRMIAGRINKRVLVEEHVKGKKSKVNSADIRKVIEETMYVPNDQLSKKDIQPGDIFKDNNGNHFVNIRAHCDTINRSGSDTDKTQLYLLKCTKISDRKIWRGRHNRTTGIVQRMTDFCVFGIDDESFFRVQYKEIYLKHYGDLARIKRLLGPHVNFLQQGYAAYCSRSGLPRIPDVVVKDFAKLLKQVGT